MMMNAGIKEIVYEDGYPDELAQEMLADSEIKVRKFSVKKQ
jgi:dCMP deaminase